jgi:hypothetical protein
MPRRRFSIAYPLARFSGSTSLFELLEKQVAELLAKAEAADSAPLEDGLTLPTSEVNRASCF